MATIVKRSKTYSVVYYYNTDSGERKQKWETFATKKEALQKKAEVEYLKAENIFPIVKTPGLSSIKTINNFMDEFITSYGKKNWSISTFSSNKSLIKNYVEPYIGKIPVHILSNNHIEDYYNTLYDINLISRVHKLMKCAFSQAKKLRLIKENPFLLVDIPKKKYKQKNILTEDDIRKLLSHCYENDYQIYMCINLAFACSMRLGEILGLTWDDIEVSKTSVKNNLSCLHVNKTLSRASKATLKELNNKDVIFTFETDFKFKKSCLVLKSPKTQSSNRTIWIPSTIANELLRLKNILNKDIYQKNKFMNKPNLVFVNDLGNPIDLRIVEQRFGKALNNCHLPDVTFHSLRHSSITYKLKLTNGDIKSVQGDSGHSQISTTMNIYAHIMDKERMKTAKNFDESFYSSM